MHIYQGEWLLTAERAAVHVATGTAVIADLHLGYDQVRCRRGESIPSFGVADVLATLESLACRHGARRLVVAGDFLEDGRRAELVNDFLGQLSRVGLELVGVVPGNHDRDFAGLSVPLPLFRGGIEVGGWRVVHGDAALPPGRVFQGHLHPCLRWRGGPSAPCFLVGKARLILPAFSPDAAGVNVLRDPQFGRFRCCVPVGERVLDFGPLARLKVRRKEEG